MVSMMRQDKVYGWGWWQSFSTVQLRDKKACFISSKNRDKRTKVDSGIITWLWGDWSMDMPFIDLREIIIYCLLWFTVDSFLLLSKTYRGMSKVRNLNGFNKMIKINIENSFCRKYCEHKFKGSLSWLVGSFYSMSTLVRLCNAEVRVFFDK